MAKFDETMISVADLKKAIRKIKKEYNTEPTEDNGEGAYLDATGGFEVLLKMIKQTFS